jgi:hypothetical protein
LCNNTRILEEKGHIIFKGAKFQKDYHLVETPGIWQLYQGIITDIETLPYGLFKVLDHLGRADTIHIARQGECDIPDSILDQMVAEVSHPEGRSTLCQK